MSASRQDNLLHRGRQCLFIGFFTSWLGIGLFFIAAASICGIIGLSGEKAGKSLVLLLSSLIVGVISVFVALHVMAIVGITVFSQISEERKEQPAPARAIHLPPKQRK